MSARAGKIAAWLRGHVEAAGARGLIFGLSGGIDSAVVARLCQMASPGHAIGVLLPCYSQPQDEEDARLLARAVSLPLIRADLSTAFDALV